MDAALAANEGKHTIASLLSQNVITNDVCLPVNIIINYTNRQVSALTDFGAISGYYISVKLHDWLKEHGAIVKPCKNQQNDASRRLQTPAKQQEVRSY